MNLYRPLTVAAMCLISSACIGKDSSDGATMDSAPKAATHSQSVGIDAATQSANSGAAETATVQDAGASICGANDKVLFSCPLAKGEKTASMCATPSKSGARPNFYYAFGRPGAIELRVPAAGRPDNAAFSRTHLGFAGNTGGYAYSFTNADYKYIVYSVSGEGSLRKGGIIVQPTATDGIARNLICRATAITETGNDQLIDATLGLKKDPQIQSNGLPDTK